MITVVSHKQKENKIQRVRLNHFYILFSPLGFAFGTLSPGVKQQIEIQVYIKLNFLTSKRE